MQKGNYDAAAQAFERSVGMKGNTEKQYSYAGLAQIYELQKKPQQAVNAWEFAIKADPNMTSAYARWIKIMRELKRNEEVLKFLSAVEKDTQAWPPSVVLAQLLVNDKNLNGAIEHIKIALERSNNAANVKQIAAGLYQEQGFQYRTAKNLDAARVSVMEAVKLYPENPDFLANLIQIELIAENIPEAQRLLDAFEKNDKNEGPRLFLQGVIRYAEKKPEEGIKLFRQSWSEAQNEGVADAIYSHYMRTEEKASALSFAQDWVEKLPKSYKANLIQAMDAQEKNKPKEAIKWYEKTIAIAPNLSVALNNLAWLYYEDKDERALELAKKAAALAPKSAEILDTYGWILVEMGDAEMGLGVLEQAAKLKPDNADIQAHLKKAKERR
jgi:cellulose synthase operon protein C